MSGFDDKELFESAISDAPAEVTTESVETPVEVVAEVTDGTARDDKGRFAPKEQAAEAVPAATTEQVAQPEAAHVPSWRLREVNEAREAAERRAQEHETRAQTLERQFADLQRQIAAQQKPKAEPVEFFTDPDAAFEQRLSPFEERMQAFQNKLTLRASKAENIAVHGRAVIDEMEAALGQAMNSGHPELPLLRQQMMSSDDPVGVAMQWYQRDKLQKETGGDLTAYRTRVQEEALKDPAFLAKALEHARAQAGQPGAKSLVQLPPSINRATGAASPHDESGDLSNESLYAAATR